MAHRRRGEDLKQICLLHCLVVVWVSAVGAGRHGHWLSRNRCRYFPPQRQESIPAKDLLSCSSGPTHHHVGSEYGIELQNPRCRGPFSGSWTLKPPHPQTHMQRTQLHKAGSCVIRFSCTDLELWDVLGFAKSFDDPKALLKRCFYIWQVCLEGGLSNPRSCWSWRDTCCPGQPIGVSGPKAKAQSHRF